MAKRSTISDLARAAGVSTATVDRVSNGYAKVREETARHVPDTANTIGYHARHLIKHRLDAVRPEYRLGFVLHNAR